MALHAFFLRQGQVKRGKCSIRRQQGWSMSVNSYQSSQWTTPLGAAMTQPSFRELPSPSMPQQLYGFEVIDILGEGAASVIYAATDPADHQLYALKHVVVQSEKDDRFVDQLINEFQIGSRISHPLI